LKSEKRQTSSLLVCFPLVRAAWNAKEDARSLPIQKTLWKLRAADIETIDELIAASSIQ
jgi:hypothetical protein